MSKAALALTPQRTFYVPGKTGKQNPTSPSPTLQAEINELSVKNKWFVASAIQVYGTSDSFIMATQTTAANDLIAAYKKKNSSTFSYTLVYTTASNLASASARSRIESGAEVKFKDATNSVADLMITQPQLFSFVLVVADTKTKKVYYPAGWALSRLA